MTADEKAALKAAYPEHAFMRVIHPLGEAIVAIPREQATEEKKAAVLLWHGATVRLSEQSCASQRQRAEQSAASS